MTWPAPERADASISYHMLYRRAALSAPSRTTSGVWCAEHPRNTLSCVRAPVSILPLVWPFVSCFGLFWHYIGLFLPKTRYSPHSHSEADPPFLQQMRCAAWTCAFTARWRNMHRQAFCRLVRTVRSRCLQIARWRTVANVGAIAQMTQRTRECSTWNIRDPQPGTQTNPPGPGALCEPFCSLTRSVSH